MVDKNDINQVSEDLENLQVKRKLASLQEVKEISTCSGDENFEKIQILGWQVVAPKGQFKVSDRVVFFEIDSKLPDDRWCTSMEFYDYKVSTVNVAGELSQGFIAHVSEVIKKNDHIQIGDDLTEELDIVKYDDEEKINDIIENSVFPTNFCPYTDEPRVQSEPKYLEVFNGKPYVATVKYDGTSGTYLLNPQDHNQLWVCSRNKLLNSKKKDDYSKMADKYKIKDILKKFPDYAVQGEIYGPGIQKNHLCVKDKQIAIFNIYNIKERRCLDYLEMNEMCEKMGLPICKLFEKGDCFSYSMDDFYEKVKGNYEGTENQREGLVFRLAKNWYTPKLRASFKIISNDFLTKK